MELLRLALPFTLGLPFTLARLTVHARLTVQSGTFENALETGKF